MAQFCYFWSMAPAEVKDMPAGMYNAFVDFQNDYVREQNKAASKR